VEDSNVPTPALSDVTVTPLPLSAGVASEGPVYPTEILVLANANASPGIENPSPPVATAAGEASWRPWLALTLVLFGVYYFVPRFVEEMQFAYTRGRQRAEFENASRLLNGSRVNQVSLEELSTTSQLVFQRIAPSVVHLNVETKSSTQPPTHELHRFYRDHAGQGSGVIIDAAGYIVTNQHVVRDAEQIRVSLSDGRSLVGKLIGTDEETDLAVIRIQAEKLIAAEWGESDDLAVGAFVWAVGSPFGLQSTVTGGIVSAKHRAGMAGTPYQDFLQTDCAVNPGSSGGPLMNTQGKIVGINTAIVGESYQGVSFAIPSRVARDVVSRIRTQGKIARGWLGIQLAEVSPEMALEQGLERAAGVYVAGLVHLDGVGPAEKAGMQTGDIVVRWNGKAVENSVALSNLVAATPVGSQAEVVLRRQGAEQTLMVEIAERPQR
jgi:serine protease Do